jgi:excisionase family DNA binding protein
MNFSELKMDNTPDSPPLRNAAEAAKRLKVSRPYIYKLEKLGLLPSVAWSVNGRKTIRFLDEDISNFIARHRGGLT